MQFLLAAGLAYEKSSRATNMTYTQMLFALSSDKIFFGQSPDITSIIGSTLIIGSAIMMAMAQANVTKGKEVAERGDGASDEEQGLMTATGQEEDHEEAMPIQEVHMRTLR